MVVPVDHATACVLVGSGSHIIRGELFVRLLPLLDGEHAVTELATLAKPPMRLPEVLYALDQLHQTGLVVDASSRASEAAALFWLDRGSSLEEARLGDQKGKIAIRGLGVEPADFVQALSELAVYADKESQRLLVLTDDYLRPELEQINRERLAARSPWMIARPVGAQLWIGPVFVPGRTGCWSCLAQRLLINDHALRFARHCVRTSVRRRHMANPIAAACSIAAVCGEAAEWAVFGRSPRLEGVLVTLDSAQLRLEDHVLTRRPQCHACGNPDLYAHANQTPRLTKRKKLHLESHKGFRIAAPHEVVARLERHVSPVTGVVPGIHRQPDFGAGLIHNYYSGRNMEVDLRAEKVSVPHVRSHNGGKGRSVEQARASALCEAIERYCWLWQGQESVHLASMEELGDSAIHPNRCMLFSDKQYSERESVNALLGKSARRVPVPFDTSHPIDWVSCWSLIDEKERYLPAMLCYRDYPTPLEELYCLADSNGCASGSCLEEAILHGLLEVIERDSVGLWWFNRISRPEVDICSFDDRYFEEVRSLYRSIGRTMWVLDVTADTHIPTVVAVSCREDDGSMIILGFGAHIDPRLAVERAITEMSQWLPIVEPNDGGTPWLGDTSSPEIREWFTSATLDQHRYLIPDEVCTLTSSCEMVEYDDLLDDLKHCVHRVQSIGLDVLVLDQTRPDVGLSVVKVIVPGMRHIWRRCLAGRLFDVPNELGWTDQVLEEDELNRISVFF